MARHLRATAAVGAVVAVGWLAWGVPAGAAQPLRVVVEGGPGLQAEADAIRRLIRSGTEPGGRLGGTLELLGLEEPGGAAIHVLVAPEGSPAARAVPEWVGGYARPAEDLVVLLPDRGVPYPDASVEALLYHELAHVLLHRAAGGAAVPRWFNEGVALVAGGQWRLQDRARLTWAALLGGEVTPAELEEAFRGGAGAVRRAYVVSEAFARYLLQAYGRAVFARILGRVADGEPFATAFRGVTAASPETVAARFWRRTNVWNRWVPLATSSVTLWVVIVLLALWARRRRRRRTQRTLERWEREEGGTRGDGGVEGQARDRREGERRQGSDEGH